MGGMAMTYGYVYVASIGMGANKQQTLKALVEAEAYDGPSLVLAYSPCINHGIKRGMGKSQEETDLAVKSGYWPLYRFHPDLKKEGKNPFVLESKEPDGSLREFLGGEIRYASLAKSFPEEANRLSALLEAEVVERYADLKRRAEMTVVVPEVEGGIAEKDAAGDDVCTLSSTAEHGGAEEPCDDSRGGVKPKA
jgi:pyruvate-ferredoxin/flavodoxin oxidoreductase